MEKQLVPKLRFPEFNGNWEEKNVSELGDFYGGGTPDSSNLDYWKGNIPWISSSDIKEDSILNINKTRFITKEAVKESATKIIPKGSVLMVSRVGIGKFAIADENICTSQDFTNLICNQNEYFIAYYFKARSNRFLRLSQGTSIQGFTIKDLKSAIFLIPILKEQQKIATFLTSVDKRITLLTQQKEKLEQYKKGIMQQLFSQKIRFKNDNGKDFPEWEEKKLGDVFSSHKGKGLSKDKLIYNGKYKCILYGELYTRYSEVILEVKNRTNIEEGELSLIGDLLVPSSTTTTGIDLANVTALNEDNVRLGGDITLLRGKEKICNIFYAYYLSNHKKNQIARYAQGTTIVHLYYNHLKVMTIDFPSFKEQQKIANFLTAIDEQIEQVGKQIDTTISFKKGLLQQLFV